ncbi:hypothetical protein T06_12638 [Trichinella sp. T6]|nr:hypothetical protein T06_12638 [Trichinella sp. T6]
MFTNALVGFVQMLKQKENNNSCEQEQKKHWKD